MFPKQLRTSDTTGQREKQRTHWECSELHAGSTGPRIRDSSLTLLCPRGYAKCSIHGILTVVRWGLFLSLFCRWRNCGSDKLSTSYQVAQAEIQIPFPMIWELTLNTLLSSFPVPRGKEAWPQTERVITSGHWSQGKLFSGLPTLLLSTFPMYRDSILWLVKRTLSITTPVFSDRGNRIFHTF